MCRGGKNFLRNRAFLLAFAVPILVILVWQVEDILQRRHSQSQPLVNGLSHGYSCPSQRAISTCCLLSLKVFSAVSALKIFSMASCDDVAIPWLLQNKTKLGASFDEVRCSALCLTVPCNFVLIHFAAPQGGKGVC